MVIRLERSSILRRILGHRADTEPVTLEESLPSESDEESMGAARSSVAAAEGEIRIWKDKLDKATKELAVANATIKELKSRLLETTKNLYKAQDAAQEAEQSERKMDEERSSLEERLASLNRELDIAQKKLVVAQLYVNRSDVHKKQPANSGSKQRKKADSEEKAHKAIMVGLQQEEEGLREKADRLEQDEGEVRGQPADLERQIERLETHLRGRETVKAAAKASSDCPHGDSAPEQEGTTQAASRLGLHLYSEQDVRYLVDNYGKVTQREMANHLGVTRKSVEGKLRSLRKAGLISVQSTPMPGANTNESNAVIMRRLRSRYGMQGDPTRVTGRYTPEEEELIATYYGTLTSGDLGRILGRPAKAVQGKAEALVAKGWMLPSRDSADLEERRSEYRKHQIAAAWDDAERQRKKLSHRNARPRFSTTDQIGSSKPEIVLFYYVNQFFPDAISRYQYVDPNGVIYEADIFIPSAYVAIEYDGGFWHAGSKLEVDDEKDEAFTAAGIYTIRVRDEGLPELGEFYGEVIINKKPKGSRNDAAIISHMVTAVIRRLGEILDVPNADELRSYELTEEQYEVDVPRYGVLLFTKQKHPNVTDYLCGKYWDKDRNFPLDPTNLDRYSSIDVWFDCPAGQTIRCNVKDHMLLEDSRSIHSILNYCPFQGDPCAAGCDRTCGYWRESNNVLCQYYAGAYQDEELDPVTRRRTVDPLAMFMIIKAMYDEVGGVTDIFKRDFVSEPREVPNGFVLPEFPSFRDLQIEGPWDLEVLQRFFDDTRFWNIRVNLDILEHDEDGRTALASFLSHRLERDVKDAEYYAETYKLSEYDDRHFRAPFDAKQYRYNIGGGFRFIQYSFHMSGEPGEVPTVTQEFKPIMVDIFKRYSVPYEEYDDSLYLTASSYAAYHQRLWTIEHKYGLRDTLDVQTACPQVKNDRPREAQHPQMPHKTAKGWNVMDHTFIAAITGGGRTHLIKAILKRLHDEGAGALFIIIDNKGIDYRAEEEWPETLACTGSIFNARNESYAAIKQAYQIHQNRSKQMAADGTSEWDGPVTYLVIDQIGPLALDADAGGDREKEWNESISMLADIVQHGRDTHVILILGSSVIDKKTVPRSIIDHIRNKVVLPVSRLRDTTRYLDMPDMRDGNEHPSLGNGYIMAGNLDHAQVLDENGILKALGI